MKQLVIVLALLASSFAFSATKMTHEQRDKYVADVAKELRRDLWIQQHEDVSSNTEYPSYKELEDFLFGEHSQYYENNLDEDEIEQVFDCYKSRSCRVYHIVVSSSYYSGYGEDSHFVLLDVYKRRHELLSHNIYSE